MLSDSINMLRKNTEYRALQAFYQYCPSFVINTRREARSLSTPCIKKRNQQRVRSLKMELSISVQ